MGVRDLIEGEAGGDRVAQVSGCDRFRERGGGFVVGGLGEVVVAEEVDRDVLEPQLPERQVGSA